MCVSIFCTRSYSIELATGHITLIGQQFLPMLLSLPGFWIGVIIALYHISGICSVEIAD